jgi:glycine/D-amino acid oxidase-like deaminating enzyme
MFFFEKKNQKTFTHLRTLPATPRQHSQESFASFLQKRRPFFLFTTIAQQGQTLERRQLLSGSIALGLAGCAHQTQPTLAPIRTSEDRLFDITVCLRPFRAAGPRIEAERINDALIIHNYGHGGSGWSLSWGSSTLAVQLAMESSPADIAVVGCGALGITSAILAQQAGARVTIYASELLPRTRSARATGSWTPDSRIALTTAAAPSFPALWEQMARTSFKTYRTYLGLPGTPVEWTDRYLLLDTTLDQMRAARRARTGLSFASYMHRIDDITPNQTLIPRGTTPFTTPYVYRSESMQFNIATYAHTLLSDFRLAGGRIVHRSFNTPAEIAALPEKTIINCPGYGARALWKDDSITPVRGQIAWLIPQADVHYGLFYNDVSLLARSDGIVVQALDGGDMKGYGNDHETPDPAEASRALASVAPAFSGFSRTSDVAFP